MPRVSTVQVSLRAQNVALGERLQRLSPVLAAMARDLASVRREAAEVRRENAVLRAQLGLIDADRTLPGRSHCDGCGAVLSTARLDDRRAGV
jgi:hypothetical protein